MPINFQNLVESFLQENKNNFLQTYGSKIPGIDAQVLSIIYQSLLPGQTSYVAAETWEPYTDFTPLFSAIVLALASDGTYKTARKEVKKDQDSKQGIQYTEDLFYDLVDSKITPFVNLIKPLDKYSKDELGKLAGDVSITHRQATKKRSNDVLVQNVWPQIQKLTIVDAVSTILKNRLTGLEKLQLKFFVPLKNISEIATGGNFDNIMSDVYKNYKTYSNSSSQYSKDITEILQNINILPEDFVKIATFTNNLYELLLNNKFQTLADDIKQKYITNSLTYDNIWKFAKEGVLTYNMNNRPSAPSRDIYTLDFIEAGRTDPGTSLINQIKSMSTGIRVKDKSWQEKFGQRLQALGSLGSNIAAFGGAKLYGN